MKFYQVLLLLLPAFSTTTTLYSAGATSPHSKEIDAISTHILELKSEETETEKEIVKKSYAIQKTILKHEQAEVSLQGLNGLGRIEQLEFKADLYAVEKQNSKQIHKELFELTEIIQKWQILRSQIAENESKFKLATKIMDLHKEDAQLENQVAKTYTKDEIKYYTVQKTATLKEISGLDDVYANSSKEYYMTLAQANPGIVKSPTKDLVPEGTTLTVPDLRKLKSKSRKENYDDFE